MHATEPSEPTEPTEPARTGRRLALLGAVAVVLVAAVIGVIVVLNRDDEVTDTEGGWIGPRNGEASVIYQFHDSSVAPEYHRSYTITVWDSSAHLVIDSYGDVLVDQTINIEPEVWQRTLDAAGAFRDTESIPNDGCTGGTADELTVLDGDKKEVVHLFIDGCAEGDVPYLAGAVGEVSLLLDVDGQLASLEFDGTQDTTA